MLTGNRIYVTEWIANWGDQPDPPEGLDLDLIEYDHKEFATREDARKHGERMDVDDGAIRVDVYEWQQFPDCDFGSFSDWERIETDVYLGDGEWDTDRG